MDRLKDKVAVITGASGGIGSAAARAFVAEGASVGLLDRSRAVDDLAGELGPPAFPLAAEATDEAAVARAFDEVARRHERLDVLYNCLGVQLHGRDARAHELDLAVWNETIAINLTGVFLCCKHGIRLMLRGGRGGSVINCGSPTGMTGNGTTYDAYSASKGGVMALSRCMAIDYARDGIRVNILVPGATHTPLTEALFGDPQNRDRWSADIPIGRLGRPEDLAGLAVFLASDESSYAIGGTFVVDGGITIR
jgi:NAD(P)-dependent dehydrogenase (short-subunit alcohol dehydrogenase family)